MHPCLLKVKARTRRDCRKTKSTVYVCVIQACPDVPVAAIGKLGVPSVSRDYGATDTDFRTIGLMLFDGGHAKDAKKAW